MSDIFVEVTDEVEVAVAVVSETVEVTAGYSGPMGPQGATGPQGPQGDPGTTLHAELTDTATDGHPASAITFTPAGGIAATDVQAALEELDGEALRTETLAGSIVDAKGDLIVATAADTPARLAVGANGKSLIADSAATPGVAWAGPLAGLWDAVPASGTKRIGLPGVQFTGTATASYNTITDHFTPFVVTDPRGITVDTIYFEVTANPVTSATCYLGIFAADSAWQPTGAILGEVSQVVPNVAGNAVYSNALSLTLPPGRYLTAYCSTLQLTLRQQLFYLGYVAATMGSAHAQTWTKGRTPSAAWGAGSSYAWDTYTGNSSAKAPVLLKWSPV